MRRILLTCAALLLAGAAAAQGYPNRALRLVVPFPPGGTSDILARTIKALAVTSLGRVSVLPDVPSLHELGLKEFDAVGWNGLLAPAATPRDIVSRVHAEVVRILRLPEVRESLTAQGADIVGNTPEQFAAWIRVEVKKWAEVIRVSGAKVD